MGKNTKMLFSPRLCHSFSLQYNLWLSQTMLQLISLHSPSSLRKFEDFFFVLYVQVALQLLLSVWAYALRSYPTHSFFFNRGCLEIFQCTTYACAQRLCYTFFAAEISLQSVLTCTVLNQLSHYTILMWL